MRAGGGVAALKFGDQSMNLVANMRATADGRCKIKIISIHTAINM